MYENISTKTAMKMLLLIDKQILDTHVRLNYSKVSNENLRASERQYIEELKRRREQLVERCDRAEYEAYEANHMKVAH